MIIIKVVVSHSGDEDGEGEIASLQDDSQISEGYNGLSERLIANHLSHVLKAEIIRLHEAMGLSGSYEANMITDSKVVKELYKHV